MKQRPSLLLAWVLIPILVLSALAACADKKEAPEISQKAAPKNGQWGAGVYVDKAWSFARDVSGHRVHVIKEKIECVKCHASTVDKMGPVTPDRCASCHEKEGHIQHAAAEASKRFGAGTKAVCTACHAFTLEGTRHDEALLKEPARVRVDGSGGTAALGVESYEPSECKRCHAVQLGALAPVEVHGTQPCLSCHKPHEGAPQSAPCSDCHKDISTSHAAQGKSLVETCSTCHEHRHAPAKEAVGTCAACHSKQQPIIPASALFAGGHTQCIGCHKPHSFEKKEATPCRTCHAQVSVIGAGSIAAHNGCTNCHSPHNVRASAPGACATCHQAVHSDHPQVVGTCVGCHDPHPKLNQSTLGVQVSSCTSCHKFAQSDHGAHQGAACTGCHKPHGFKLALSNVATCNVCHAARVQQVSSNPGHQACSGCHSGLPHHPEPDKVACSNCHQKQAGLVKPGHARCTGCHEPHSGAQIAACASCHRAEQQTAPKGHQVCTNCHEPHVGLPTQKVCADCHRAEQQSAHGRLGSGCQTCHRPHGPTGVASVPACASCHQLEKLPGLHAEPKHRPCATCHTGHEDPAAPKREICVSCHKDRTDHFPQSPRCAGCHLFTKTP
ncbi:MAG TPA: hypothetical protein VGC79_07365 [Polyangiaceae bacterium]